MCLARHIPLGSRLQNEIEIEAELFFPEQVAWELIILYL